MPCDCVTYVCLNVYFLPCAAPFPIGLTSTYTGTLSMIVEVGGMYRRTDIEVIEGEPIIVPNVFNENYNHLVQFIKADGELYNDTCYQIQTMATILSQPVNAPSSPIDISDVVGLQAALDELQAEIDAILQGDGVQTINYSIGNGQGQMPAGSTFIEAIPANTEPVAVLIGTVLLANEEIGTGAGSEGEPVTVTLTNYSVYNGQSITILYKPVEG